MADEQRDFFSGDPNEAKRLRDAALKRVADNGGDWREQALLRIVLIESFEGMGEDLKIILRRGGLPEPHHVNAWGDVIKEAIKQGVLIPTGKWAHSKLPLSHARQNPVYRRRRT